VIKTDGLIWGYNKTCGYCLLHFDTKAEKPQVKLEAYDNSGELLFAKKIDALKLRFKD
jgi:hypothetical protein